MLESSGGMQLRTRLVRLLAILLTASVCGNAQNPSTLKDSGAEILRQYDEAMDALAAKVLPAIVQIDVSGYGAPEDSKDQDSTDTISRQRALGSGVIVDPDGYIMTNNHVVAGAQRIRVTITPITRELTTGNTNLLRSQRVYDAKVLGSNRDVDLALLKIDAKELPFIPLNENFSVRLGQTVLAVGSPEGLEHSVTRGIVSGVGRQIDPDRPMVYIQTDAPINPGNSGGALVDRDGNLVGLNTFILTQGGGSEGLGFAIPEPVVRFVYQEFRQHGRLRRVTIGAHAQDITPDLAAGLKLQRDWGVVISDVLPGSPAEAAGLLPKDIVLTVDNRVVDSLPKFGAFLYLHRHDQPVAMEILRGDQPRKLVIKAVESPTGVESLADLIDPQKDLLAPLGIFALDLTPKLAESLPDLRSKNGVVVVARTDFEPRLDAELAAGDVIRSVNGKPVANSEALSSALAKFKVGDPVVLEVERKGVFQFVTFETE
jgi:serine protease Do